MGGANRIVSYYYHYYIIIIISIVYNILITILCICVLPRHEERVP